MEMSAIPVAVITLAAIALIVGLALSFASGRLPASDDNLVDQVNALLPQTQCAQCGYPGCRPYAKAIATDEAAINLCPPGGDDTVSRLAELLGREPVPLAEEAPVGRSVAIIDEALCIGCTHCRNACPVDAIVGTHQLMHTIIATECTGCELCIAPCPVDCISLRRVA
jgi:H+/Na+-translocating ferredoxin:NAD+ oxidoreductase subunit B